LTDVLGVFFGEKLERLVSGKRSKLTGRGRAIVVVVSDGEARCDEPDYQEADYEGS